MSLEAGRQAGSATVLELVFLQCCVVWSSVGYVVQWCVSVLE